MSTASMEDARRAIARGAARLRAAIDAREEEDMQLGPIEDGPRYPVIAYSQVPEDGSDVGQAGQDFDKNAEEVLRIGYQRLDAAGDDRAVRARRIRARHVPMYPKVVINA